MVRFLNFILPFYFKFFPFLKQYCNFSQATRRESSSSSSSLHSESEDDVPLSKLKRPPRKPFDVSSDEEDNTPLSELAKEPSQYHLQSQSSHDEDMEKEEEEEGDASDSEEPWDGMVEEENVSVK